MYQIAVDSLDHGKNLLLEFQSLKCDGMGKDGIEQTPGTCRLRLASHHHGSHLHGHPHLAARHLAGAFLGDLYGLGVKLHGGVVVAGGSHHLGSLSERLHEFVGGCGDS